MHRVGRTGRAGRTGISMSFMTREDWSQAGELITILREAEQEVPKEVEDMAERFRVKKEREAAEGGRPGFRGGRGGGRGRGGGGRNSGFGGGFW